MSNYDFTRYWYDFYQKYQDDVQKIAKNPEKKEKFNREMRGGRWLYMLTVPGLYRYYGSIYDETKPKHNKTEYPNKREGMLRYFGQNAKDMNYSKEVDPFYKAFELLEQPITKEETEIQKKPGKRSDEEKKQITPETRKKLVEELQEQKEKEQIENMRYEFEEFFRSKRLEKEYYIRQYAEVENSIYISLPSIYQSFNEWFDDIYNSLSGIPNYQQIFEYEWSSKFLPILNSYIIGDKVAVASIEGIKTEQEYYETQQNLDEVELVTYTNDGRRIQRVHNIPKDEIWLFLDNEQKFYIPISI